MNNEDAPLKRRNYCADAEDLAAKLLPEPLPPLASVGRLRAIVQHVHGAGRLDRATSGLVLCGTDGGLQCLLAHPCSHVSKTYEVALGPSRYARVHAAEGPRDHPSSEAALALFCGYAAGDALGRDQ